LLAVVVEVTRKTPTPVVVVVLEVSVLTLLGKCQAVAQAQKQPFHSP
jgi:hypothetical protein